MLLPQLDRYEPVGALDHGRGVVDYVAEYNIVILDLDLPDVTGIRPIVENMQNNLLPLFPRQLTILHFLKTEVSNKEISFRLGIAMPTASFHIGEIRKKLGVSDNKKTSRKPWRPAYYNLI